MEDEYAIVGAESDLSLPTTLNRVVEHDPLASNFPTWSSRYKCFQAYICVVMSYMSAQKFCESVGKFGCEWYYVIFSHCLPDKLESIFFSIFVPYLIFNVIIGIPAVLVEIMIGRYVMGNMTRVWNMCVPAKGVFWCLFTVTVYAVTLNHICSIYLLKYFFSSFYGYIRWGTCGESWAKINCYVIGKQSEAFARCLKTQSEEFCHGLNWESSGFQFWKHSITNTSNRWEIMWSICCLFIAVLVCTMIILKGINSLEKVLGLLVYPSVILWATLVIVSLSVSDVLKGFKKLFYDHWGSIASIEVWLLGFEDSLYFLGLGRLSLGFVSSHGKITDNILLDVLTVNFCGVVSCLLITTPILSIVANTKGLDKMNNNWEELFQDLIDTFISMSEALLFYPYPNTLWSALYYLDCFLVTCSSQAVLVLAICESLEGLVNKEGKKFFFLIATSSVTFLLALSACFFEVTYQINLSTVVVTNVVLCTLTWQLFYGVQKFNSDYYFMMGYPLPIFIKCTWIILLPLPLAILILKMYYRAPSLPLKDIVFIYIGMGVLLYTFNIIFHMISFKIHKKPLSQVFKANPDWGPDNALLKKSRLVFAKSTVTTEFMYRQELYKKPLMKPPNFSEQNIVQLI